MTKTTRKHAVHQRNIDRNRRVQFNMSIGRVGQAEYAAQSDPPRDTGWRDVTPPAEFYDQYDFGETGQAQ